MASIKLVFVVLAVLVSAAPMAVVAGDPDILTDFVAPTYIPGIPATNITGDFFTYTGFAFPLPPLMTFSVLKASMAQFPALDGQSVSYAKLRFPPGTVNPTHTHPRASELLFLLEGALSVGFIDTAGKLYAKDLAAGDMFVFPKGLVHYQYNPGNILAVAFSAFGSAFAGTVNVPSVVFGTDIDDAVLAKSFKTDVPTVLKLKAALTPPPTPMN
ncbi:germin-like protein 9-3 [Brachypodium distachyon]|uniref:Germin-like protein n=1 Tax=Brachypodium distachyon TaxID=15368 RepID=I1IT21_BRADI|nr:germin-like protein 9-3 [Brachypodium distachyon]KQJ91596.1 hypothetical protein BRADI_4g38575v3 [Brachypodium distachyon]|eukprot:XP_003576869.1 germin-like protein 9-3 [Brachypodium distachyon]